MFFQNLCQDYIEHFFSETGFHEFSGNMEIPFAIAMIAQMGKLVKKCHLTLHRVNCLCCSGNFSPLALPYLHV